MKLTEPFIFEKTESISETFIKYVFFKKLYVFTLMGMCRASMSNCIRPAGCEFDMLGVEIW